MATPRPVGSSLKRNLIAPRASTSDEEDSLRCRLDEIERCSVAELQVLYIDALWAYYHGGKDTLSDEEFDRIKSELCWQGSGFPTLRRYEVDFVQASLSYYRGEPVVSDEEYEALKQKVRESGKRKDVTAMLLYTKGQEALSDEQFALFADDMRKLGVDVKITEQNLMCTLSDTTDKLNNEIGEVIRMYAAIGAIPQTISVSTWALLSLLFGGPAGLVASAPAGVPVAGLTGAAITTFLIKYLGLDDPQVLLGVCPCCESEVKGFFSSRTPVQQDVKCSNCGTQMVFDSNLGKIVSAGGFEYLSSANSTSQVSFDYNDVVRGVTRGLAEALPTIASPELKKSTKPKLAKGEKEPLVDQLKTGIFAWAVLAGYAIFGEKFIGRVRGKGIALHSGVINDFCKEFSVPNAMRQKYIQTAKKNGHDLGFLVPGGYFGDGLAGEAAMKWWRSTGW
eukprot:CAMPEP_0167749290 /NCGR_PEP_ID=MMETSP0110_2-20121227/5320_1 /TAXON_ID=629695 /ORGANISM="Gymnochlora sp., Strain CCMP2014" /LENGTH=449 /DNA_ID=CAMNT_0007634417 /DNA_START=233 /DNA_END=1582 /DNA_ORIENTATION=+